MDVISGFKQTDAGLIPADWIVRAVREFASIQTGPFGTLLKASEYSQGDGTPLISVGEIRGGFFSITDETPRVSDAVVRRLPQYVMKKGDIAFGRKGGIDRSALIREPQQGWFLGSDGIRVRASQVSSPEYLALQFQSNRVQRWLLQHAIGTTMPSLNQDILRRVEIPFPPTNAEQEGIAEALSDADALIESLEQLLAKKRRIKQGAMQELLTGKKRLPGFEIKASLKHTDLGPIPEDWGVSTVGEEFSIQLGKMLDAEKNFGVLKPYLGNRAVQWGRIDLSEISEVRLSQSDIQKYRLRDEDILVCEGGEVGRAAIWRQPIDECYYQKALHRLRPKRGYNVQLMVDVLRNLAMNGFLQNFVTQTSIAHLPKEKFETVLIPLPPSIGEQHAIAKVLGDMDEEIETLEAKLAKARALKQGMMQELLTGRIRLI